MKDSDLIPGRCYYFAKYLESEFDYLIKYEGDIKICKYIDIHIKDFRKWGIFSNEITREASPQETHWMEECIKHDIFISFEEAMKTFYKSYNSSFPKELIHLLKQLKLA